LIPKPKIALEWGATLVVTHETAVPKLEKPVFVHHYPSQSKAFYMEKTPGRPEVCESVDLLAPEGYGEIIGGGQRMSRVEDLENAIKRMSISREAYAWYIDLRRYGSTPHSGFGLGVERTVTWLCGLSHIREAIAFPRLLGRIYP
jgi:asparaginyl-tRNA synthetase